MRGGQGPGGGNVHGGVHGCPRPAGLCGGRGAGAGEGDRGGPCLELQLRGAESEGLAWHLQSLL